MPTMSNDNEPQQSTPAPTMPRAPERELEEKLRDNPGDDDAKVDVGSDQSMDASDPPAVVHPGHKDEPVPSSGFPD